MTNKTFFTHRCYFYVVPGDTFLFDMPLPYLPAQGMLVKYFDGVSTVEYSVQDVVLEVDKVASIPGSPGPPIIPETEETHVPGWRIEIQVVA